MNYKKIFKRESKVMAYIVICLTIAVIGASYAMFLQVNKNTKNQVVETGTLVITYKNGNGSIVGSGDIVTNAVCLEPMSDTDAQALTDCSYKLNILNTGSLPAQYKLVMYNNVNELPAGGTFANHNLIRVGIKKGTTTLTELGKYTLSEMKHTDDTKNETAQNKIKYVLDEGVLEPGSDITYSVQSWINETLATTAVSGQYVYLKLDVNSIVSDNAGISPDQLKNFGITDKVVTTGTGIYEVNHDDANITYTTDKAIINNLKMTEYRYAGQNPNNYVTFNGESAGWRIIGLVNTPEGQRIKLVRKDSIGDYSWDSSASNVNAGYGVNEWSQADLMTLLNNGPYYNRTSGTCYNGQNNATTSCDFSSTGLTTTAKNMIDTVTWNTGGTSTFLTTNQFYNYERSNNIKTFDDGVLRTTSWKGQVGLIYPSDYGYATSGGATTSRNTCLSTNLDSISMDCEDNDWLQLANYQWTMMPIIDKTMDKTMVMYITNSGEYDTIDSSLYYAYSNWSNFPSLYLKTNIKIKSGTGTASNPYVLGT